MRSLLPLIVALVFGLHGHAGAQDDPIVGDGALVAPRASDPVGYGIADGTLARLFPAAIDQGSTNICAGAATAAVLSYFVRAMAEQTQSGSATFVQSALYLQCLLRHDTRPADLPGFLASVNTRSTDLILSDSAFPTSAGACEGYSSARASATDLDLAFAKLRDVGSPNSDLLRDIRAQIDGQVPVIVAVYVPTGLRANYRETLFPRPRAEGGVGHAMVIVGYDDSRAAFDVVNSYGAAWGTRGGRVWLPYAAVADPDLVPVAATIQPETIEEPESDQIRLDRCDGGTVTGGRAAYAIVARSTGGSLVTFEFDGRVARPRQTRVTALLRFAHADTGELFMATGGEPIDGQGRLAVQTQFTGRRSDGSTFRLDRFTASIEIAALERVAGPGGRVRAQLILTLGEESARFVPLEVRLPSLGTEPQLTVIQEGACQ